MTTTDQHAAAPDTEGRAEPAALGVGARLSLHPMTSDFAPVILDALRAARRPGVEVVTDDVSTFLRGDEQDVVAFAHAAIATAAASGAHVVAHLHLSRGCPGEVSCAVDDSTLLRPVVLDPLPRSGQPASAHWALYPLDDGGPDRPGDHMAGILAAIEHARGLGVVSGTEHFVTRLDGDLADVLTAVAQGWLLVGREVRHVVSHATISLNSPSAPARAASGSAAATR